MSARKVRVEFVDAQGQGVAGVSVKASGCAELETGPAGQAFFLVEDAEFALWANGAEVWRGALASAPEKLVFRQDGSGWQLA